MGELSGRGLAQQVPVSLRMSVIMASGCTPDKTKCGKEKTIFEQKEAPASRPVLFHCFPMGVMYWERTDSRCSRLIQVRIGQKNPVLSAVWNYIRTFLPFWTGIRRKWFSVSAAHPAAPATR